MANISNVINVSLLQEGQAAARDSMNVVSIITSSQEGPLSSANRYEVYTDAQSVATDFGSTSAEASYANTFFGTQPNAVNAGGLLVMGYWRGASESVDATAAVLSGAQLTETTVVSEAQQISDGTLNIDVDGATVNVTALDLQDVLSLSDIATKLNTAITGATVTVSNSRIVVTSDTTGALSTLSFATDPGTGTYVGVLLGLSDGEGGTLTQGAAADTLTAETQLAAITELKSQINIKGAMFIDEAAGEREDIAEWAQANNTLVYEVFSDATNLNVDATNTVWAIKLSGYTNYRMLYSKAGNRKLATAYMARAHTVNFGADNSALTMNLKNLPVTAEDYSQSEITSAKNVGLDIYTTIKNVPIVLTSGANDFVDNRYNLIAFVDAVATDLFNVLNLTSTKIPQTTAGVNQLVSQAEQTSRQFVRAGVFAPGEWSSPDTFGDVETFTRSIRQNGFYWLAGRLADQPQADRQARKSPVIQGAVKNAGAIHSADVVIFFNL